MTVVSILFTGTIASAASPVLQAIHPVLAHQGGWDEILMVVVPVAVFAGLLYVANSRASRLGDGTGIDDDGKAKGSGTVATGGSTKPAGPTEKEKATSDDLNPDVRNPRRGPL